MTKGAHEACSMSPGTSAVDPGWRQDVRSEHHTGIGAAYVALLWDVKNCDEHVSHFLLRDEALETSFPRVVLRVSFPAYVWPRVLKLDRAAALPLFHMLRAIATYCVSFLICA